MLPTRDDELVDKSAGLVQRKRFSAAHARSREAHQDRWYRQLQLRGSVTRFLLVEEAQHRLPYARFLYFVGLQASCNCSIIGNRVAFQEGGCVVHLKSAYQYRRQQVELLISLTSGRRA
jgi:hypothetical protein